MIVFRVSDFIDLTLNVFELFFLLCSSIILAFLSFCKLAFVKFLLSKDAIFSCLVFL